MPPATPGGAPHGARSGGGDGPPARPRPVPVRPSASPRKPSTPAPPL